MDYADKTISEHQPNITARLPKLGEVVNYETVAGEKVKAVINLVWTETCVNLVAFVPKLDEGFPNPYLAPAVETSVLKGSGPRAWSFENPVTYRSLAEAL